MLEVGITTRRPILKLVKTRSRRVLLRVIRRHVKRGSYIMSDEWRVYRGQLSQYGYQHFSVCHKDNFVDARTGSHTQHIERAWQTYKGDIWRHRGNRTSRLLKYHLRLIEWRYWLGNKHPEGNPQQAVRRYRKILQQYKRGKNLHTAYKAIGVDRNTVVASAPIAELAIVAPQEYSKLLEGQEKLQVFAKKCMDILNNDAQLLTTVEMYKKKNKLLPLM
ncbi:hypothetical protein SRHO_G00123730 [Serrasalmus rhombeus]